VGTSPLTATPFPPSYCGTPGQTFDQHNSWWNDDAGDDLPFFASTTALSHIPVYNICTVAEIFAAYAPTNPTLSGKIIRFAHNYTTNVPQGCGENGIVTVSQDGKYALFCSPMATTGTSFGQLGDTAGHFPATGTSRVDIFMLWLQ
jgi:hypothetical protein